MMNDTLGGDNYTEGHVLILVQQKQWQCSWKQTISLLSLKNLHLYNDTWSLNDRLIFKRT